MLDHATRLLPGPAGASCEKIALEHCKAEWIRGKGVNGKHVVLYFHGGAFFTCGLNTHRRLAVRLSSATDAAVFSIEYRQFPHHPIAAAIADGVEAYTWLLNNGCSASQITVAGDSAGGYLAYAVTSAAMAAGLDKPASIVAMSPLLDLKTDGKLLHRNAGSCECFPSVALERLERVARRIDDRHEAKGAAVSRTEPVDLYMADMPPSLIQIGSREILVADAELMAHRLTAAGASCELQIWDRQVHVFQAAASWVPEGQRAIAEVAAFIRAHATADSTDIATETPSVMPEIAAAS